jgi:ABC-2 type transport system ATP-binding protein
MIEFKNVTKIYPNGTTANENISFNVPRNKTVGIVGENGSGKTTLLRQLFQIISISKGEIYIDEEDKYIDKLAYVPQFPSMYPSLTVKESIMSVLRYQKVRRKDANRKVDKILEEVGLVKFQNQHVYTLSGGQQKLLAFACGLVQDKPYLILDEVTSMVDIVTKEKIWMILEKYKKEKGILLASHDMSEVKRLCDYIIVLKEGKLIFQGSPTTIGSNYCKAKIKVENTVHALSVLSNYDKNYEIFDNQIVLIEDSLDQTLQSIRELNKKEEVIGFSCEYPAFYEEVLAIVKGN